jgi:hypothetical protein
MNWDSVAFFTIRVGFVGQIIGVAILLFMFIGLVVDNVANDSLSEPFPSIAEIISALLLCIVGIPLLFSIIGFVLSSLFAFWVFLIEQTSREETALIIRMLYV